MAVEEEPNEYLGWQRNPPKDKVYPNPTSIDPDNADNSVKMPDREVQNDGISKPPSDANTSAQKRKKFRVFAAAVVGLSFLVVFLWSTGIVGRSARRNGEETTVETRQVGKWVGNKHLEKHNVSTPSCVDLSDWIDFYEDSCDWYEENEPEGCPNEGNVTGTDNVTASEACCHCHTSNNVTGQNGDIHGKSSDVDPPQWLISLLVVILIILTCCNYQYRRR